MGIRLHKYIGYGLTDIETDDKEHIIDSRINLDSFLFDAYDERKVPSLETYLDWLEDNKKDVLMDKWYIQSILDGSKERKRDFTDVFCWRSEYGDPAVMVFQPFGCTRWSRGDDDIDYIQEADFKAANSANKEFMDNYVKVLKQAPYPYQNYMDKNTTNRVANQDLFWINSYYEKENPDDKDKLIAYSHATKMGYSSIEEARDCIIPETPEEVRALIEFSEIFKSPETWKELRPMLYTYWG